MHPAAPSTTAPHPPASAPGEPARPVALLFPFQGQWTEADYLALQKRTNRLVELSDGFVEVLPMASPFHQRIVVWVLDGPAYRLHGEFARGAVASSVLLPDFTVAVNAVFEAAAGVRQ